jgi:hypothetical protein
MLPKILRKEKNVCYKRFNRLIMAASKYQITNCCKESHQQPLRGKQVRRLIN